MVINMSGMFCVFNSSKDKNLLDTFSYSLVNTSNDYIDCINSNHAYMKCVYPSYCKFNYIHKYTYFDKSIDIMFYGRLKRNKQLLNNLSIDLYTLNDEELVAALYCLYQEKCLDYIEGSFIFVIVDNNNIFAARDHLGLMPLYYYKDNDLLIISSKIKCILDYLGKCIVDKNGIKELLGVGPSMSPGKTIYKDIYSLKPAHYIKYNNADFNISSYWTLSKKEIYDNYDDIIRHIKDLVIDNTMHQYDNNCVCLLSGGLDSSIIASILSNYTKISTYSLEYENQYKDFISNEYQTTQDPYYINLMNNHINNNHTGIIVSQKELHDYLLDSLKARDMPGMSDIDSSLYALLNNINSHIILSGECADEIFGGYPWFYREELYNQNYFPWMRDLDKRIEIINKDLESLNIKDYIINLYKDSLANNESIIKRTILLNYEWFMQTLIKRGETISNILNKEIRMPFASKDIIEYLYNVPDNYFFINNEEKSLLRTAFETELPNEIVHRKKNPFPKTYSSKYTDIVISDLNKRLENKDSILYKLFDKDHLYKLIETKGSSFDQPWYGQLMKGPQFIAYLIQIDMWAFEYNVTLEL